MSMPPASPIATVKLPQAHNTWFINTVYELVTAIRLMTFATSHINYGIFIAFLRT
ncbi:Uncharacterised protein [Serratia quinivorans]|nr:Uncharacterised protein [Serratia quinivorans]CAI1533955.1 Uncharacterised protein [Serratia quinivorans]